MLPMLGITGYNGSGKTTLLEKLLPQLKQRGLRPAVNMQKNWLKKVEHITRVLSPEICGAPGGRI